MRKIDKNGACHSCPSCDSLLVRRMEANEDSGWKWIIGSDIYATPIKWCPEHGCDLEFEYQQALKEERTRRV